MKDLTYDWRITAQKVGADGRFLDHVPPIFDKVEVHEVEGTPVLRPSESVIPVYDFGRVIDQRDELQGKVSRLENELREVKARKVAEWASHNSTIITQDRAANFYVAVGIALGVIFTVMAVVLYVGLVRP